MHHNVIIEQTGEQYACAPDESILHAMARIGRRGIPIGCRGGGCGVCKVKITSGDFDARRMSRDHVSAEEEADRTILACRTYPRSDLSLQVVGPMGKSACRTRV